VEVIPVPEKLTVVPALKLVPVIITGRLVTPWTPEEGVIEVIVGKVEGAAVTVKVPVANPFGLVTVTVRGPVVAVDVILTVAVI
jgi:hypothetical protein